MGLKSDIEEITNFWNGAPWRVKIFLALSFFLSTSSIASLSEAVFKWEGFALDALNLYRSHVALPVGSVLVKMLGHAVDPDTLDCMVIFTLFFSGITRAIFFRVRSPARRAIDLIVLSVSYSGMIYLFLNPSHPDSTGNSNKNAIWIIYALYLLGTYVIMKGAERILALSYMLAPATAVGIMGAISAGLNR